MSDDDFSQLEERLEGLLAGVSAEGRRELGRKIGQELRRSIRMRIKAQRNPDGSSFAPRKTPQKERPASPVRFVYKKPGGKERDAEMTSWSRQGRMLVGYDREAGGMRSFRQDRVVRWLKAKAGGGGKNLRGKKGHIKRRKAAMFGRIGSRLKSRSDANSVTLGFYGQVGRIARVHQFGLRDRVSERGGQVDYPQRQLLGLTDDDRRMIEDMVIEHLSGR